MAIPVKCAACGSTFNVNEKYAGQRFACRNCRAALEVPAASPAASTPSAPRRTVSDSKGATPQSVSTSRPNPQSASDPNALRVTCPGCGNVTMGNVAYVGRRVRCKQCSQEFHVTGAGLGQIRAASTPPSSPAIDLGVARPPLDDLLTGIPIQVEAPRPLAPAPVRKAPVERKVSVSRYDDDYLDGDAGRSATTDNVLGILGLIWAIGMIGLMGWGFSQVGLRGAIIVLPMAVGVPHAVVYLTALIRMAYHGNPGTAIACFVGGCFCGIGEIVALVLCHQHARKWRMEGLLPAWASLFVSIFVVSGGVYIYLQRTMPKTGLAQVNQRSPAQSNQRFEDRKEILHEAPSGPPTPAVAAPNLDAVFAKCDRKIANRDALAKLLESVRDAESAKSVAAKYKELQDAYQAMDAPTIPPTASVDQQRRYSDFLRRDAEATARIVKEEFRIRAIAGAAEPLGLAPRDPEVEDTKPVRPTSPRERPKPTTPEERINYAIEDLNGGDHFRSRDAVKVLRSVEVDESRREDVSKALQIVLTGGDHFLQEDAAAALVKWATRKNIPALIELLSEDRHSHGDARKHAIRALAQFKDDKCARAVAKMLFTDDWQVAVEALKELGPVSEAAVLPLIDNDDPRMRFQVCGILEEVGSSRSVDDLKRHANGDRIRDVKQAAKDAVKAIESRSGKSTKGGK